MLWNTRSIVDPISPLLSLACILMQSQLNERKEDLYSMVWDRLKSRSYNAYILIFFFFAYGFSLPITAEIRGRWRINHSAACWKPVPPKGVSYLLRCRLWALANLIRFFLGSYRLCDVLFDLLAGLVPIWMFINLNLRRIGPTMFNA